MEPYRPKKNNIYLLVICAVIAFTFFEEKLSAQSIAASPGKREEAMKAVRLRDYVKAKELFDALAQAGDVDAEYQLGVLYQAGKGAAKDYKKAFSLFKRSAERNHPKAQYALASMYENGLGVDTDYKEALIWYKKSSDSGYAQALIKVKSMSKDGLLIERNPNISKNELLLAEARRGGIKIIEPLLKEGVDINFRDNFGRSALMEAIDNGQPEAAQFLIQKGADPEIFNNDGDNALLIATEKKNMSLVKALLEAGSNINIANKNGLTPLMLAVKNNDAPLVRLLIDNKADVKKVDLVNQNALQMSLVRGYKEISDILMAIGRASLPSNEKDPAILKAIIANLETVKGVDKGMAFEKGNTLMLNAWRGEADIVEQLIQHKAKVDIANKRGDTALAIAVRAEGSLKILRRFAPQDEGSNKVKNSPTPQLTSVLITRRFKRFELISPGQGIGYAFGVTGVSLMLILFIYSFRKRMSELEIIGSLKAWFRIHMALGILGPLFILLHANFHLGSFNSNVALFSMLIVSASGIAGRYIYSRIHYGLYGELANLIELKNKLEEQKEEVGLEFALIPGAREELFSFSNGVLTPSTSLIKSVKKFLTVRWNARSSFCKIQHLSAGYINQGIEMQRKARIFLDQTIKVAEFNFYERLFSFWHMLHIPLVFMLLFAAVMHVIAVNRY